MAGLIKVFGIISIFIIFIALIFNMNTREMMVDELFEGTRTTQLNTISDSLNLGDLIVNNNLSISQENAIIIWMENFKENRNLNLTHIVDIIGIHEDPPAIAVHVKGYSSLNMTEDTLELDYINLIMIDEK